MQMKEEVKRERKEEGRRGRYEWVDVSAVIERRLREGRIKFGGNVCAQESGGMHGGV